MKPAGRAYRAFISLPFAVGVGCSLPAPMAAQETGLLLGIADRVHPGTIAAEDSVPQRLRTYWITVAGGRAELVAQYDGVIVPRGQGFSRILLVRMCSDTSVDALEASCKDSLWINPVGRSLPRGATQSQSDPCHFDYLAINFVSPALLALRQRHGDSELCEPRGWSWRDEAWAKRLGSDAALGFGDFGLAARSAYRAAATQARNVGAEQSGPPPPQDEFCRALPDEDAGWTIVRERAAWVAHVFQQAGNALCQLEGPIQWSLPESVLGYAEPKLDWQAVSGTIREAEQAFASPRGNLVLATLPTAFRLHAWTAGMPGALLLELPRGMTMNAQEQVVMVQWALGSSVPRWTRLLAQSAR